MIKNYIKIALRSLDKDRIYSAINILGLALGIGAALMITAYVVFENSFDQDISKRDNIYRIRVEGITDAGEMQFQSARCYPVVGPLVKERFPEVLEFGRFVKWELIVAYENENKSQRKEFWEERVAFADPTFLELFDISLLQGKPEEFKGIDNILISESMARKYFGTTDPTGKSLTINTDRTCQVIGVFEDAPVNQHLQYDFLIPYDALGGGVFETSWAWNGFFTYLLLEENADIAKLEREFVDMIFESKGDYFRSTEYREDLLLQPLSSIHLHSNFEDEAETNGNYRSVAYLSILAIFIIIIAWVNYVNLTTAKAVNRAKEVGIRKTTGATKGQLVVQFLMESALVNLIAILLGLTLAQSSLPMFEDLLEGRFMTSIFELPQIWLNLLIFWSFGSLVSGLYPAFVLSNYDPVRILKGAFKSSSKGHGLRKALIIIQFSASILLISATYVVYRQVAFMRAQDLGVSLNQKLIVKGPTHLHDSIDGRPQHVGLYEFFKTQVATNPRIDAMSISSTVPGSNISEWGGYIRRKGASRTEARAYYLSGVTPNFIDFFDFEVLYGRSFDEDLQSDYYSVVLNEEAVKNLGFASVEEAIDSELYFPYGGQQNLTTARIIGVVKNIHQHSLRTEFQPTIYHLENTETNYFSFALTGGAYDESIEYIQGLWEQKFPETPFEYFFLDDYFDRQYKSDVRFGILFSSFSCLSLIIACMGMFGLTSFNIIQRTKEVGIRKTLGAPVASLVALLSKEIFRLLFIASLLATPLAYYALSNWLTEFPFRIALQWWFFAVPIAMVMLTALCVVGYKIVKSAYSNPVDSLRYE